MGYKTAIGALSVAIAITAYAIYIWQTTREESIQPHPVSWFVWALVTGVAWWIQLVRDGGPGSWVTFFTALACAGIGILSWVKNDWELSAFDVFCGFAGITVLLFYLISKNATQSAVLATVADVIGYGSTIKQGWTQPDKDSATSFALNSGKFLVALFALESFSIATWLYPATLVVVNAGVAVMLLARRRQMAHNHT